MFFHLKHIPSPPAALWAMSLWLAFSHSGANLPNTASFFPSNVSLASSQILTMQFSLHRADLFRWVKDLVFLKLGGTGAGCCFLVSSSEKLCKLFPEASSLETPPVASDPHSCRISLLLVWWWLGFVALPLGPLSVPEVFLSCIQFSIPAVLLAFPQAHFIHCVFPKWAKKSASLSHLRPSGITTHVRRAHPQFLCGGLEGKQGLRMAAMGWACK